MRRIYHPYWKWECFNAGMYESSANVNSEQAKIMYRDFLSDLVLFESALKKVISEWKYSCEHFLTNSSINKIAWLGQASTCIELGLPCKYRAGFCLLTIDQQRKANKLAEKYLKIWKEKYKSTSRNGKGWDIQMEFQM